MKEVDLKYIGQVDINVLLFIRNSIRQAPYERLEKFLKENNIGEDEIEKMHLHENEEIKYFQIVIKDYEEDLYFQVKKEDWSVEQVR
jgi:hypothetical protein